MIKSTPKNIEDYIAVSDDEICFLLQEKGFNPSYGDCNFLYFDKIKEIEKIIKESNKGVKSF